MKKIIITEHQFNKLFLKSINEGIYDSNDKEGSVVVKKDTNPSDIKKLTDNGLNVSIIDEKLGEEQEITYRHKFEAGKLNIYVTKEKSSLEAIMDYVYSIKDQTKVESAFEKNKVFLFVKDSASGRYVQVDTKLEHKYFKNVSGFKNFTKNKHSQDKTETLDS